MSLAKAIIYGQKLDIQAYLDDDNSLEDLDEYGFTLLIECAIAGRLEAAKALLAAGADLRTADVSGRTPLHWAVYQNDLKMTEFLLQSGADPNAVAHDGLSIFVYPLLRRQDAFKKLLYQFGGKVDPALDFIFAKLLGHRYELKGTVDILSGKGEFVDVDYEGFILEFTVALVRDALSRFMSSFSTRKFREYFQDLYPVIDAFELAESLLQLQHVQHFELKHEALLRRALEAPLLILPAASQGHALGFVRYKNGWAKVDRGEHAKKEGSVNFYQITHPEALTVTFLKAFLYQRQPRAFFHETINDILGLIPIGKLPIPAQIVGNCSWANIQALVPAAYYLKQAASDASTSLEDVMTLFEAWVEWDQDRALDECLERFERVSTARKASLAAMLAAVLFQACNADCLHDLERAEKILTVLERPEYRYILGSYFNEYCINHLTPRGNNLLKILDDCGVNPNIGVNPIATKMRS